MNASHDNQSFALAFAVAALQHGLSPEQNMPHSFLAEQRNRMTHSVMLETPSYDSQSTGSGSEDQPFSRQLGEQLEEQGSDRKLEKSRERNREHARRTRIRKKEHLESLQIKVRELETERKHLKQKMEECKIASILLGMSSNDEEPQNEVAREITESDKERVNDSPVAFLTEGKRKRFFVECSEFQFQSEPLKVSIDGQLTVLGGGCHVNWKTGVYSDSKGLHKKLTPEQLQKLRYVTYRCEVIGNESVSESFLTHPLDHIPIVKTRRERNRMHAKLTRDRKKCFISVLEKTIEDLETDVGKMRATLARVSVVAIAPGLTSQIVTPSRSPIVSPSLSHQETDDDVSAYSMDAQHTSTALPLQRARNGVELAS